MSELIQVSKLIEARKRRKEQTASAEDIKLLQKYLIVDENDLVISGNFKALSTLRDAGRVRLVDKVLTPYDEGTKERRSTSSDYRTPKGGEEEEEKSDEEEDDDLQGLLIKTDAEAMDVISQTSFAVDIDKLRKQLEEYLSTIPKEDVGYLRAEITIYHFGLNPVVSPNVLISSGTRVLDAIIYCACVENRDALDIFLLKSVEQLPVSVMSRNLEVARKAIKAGVLLFWTQGSLPQQKQESGKQVSRYVKEVIYGDSTITAIDIAKQLSTASTTKFPGSVFLNIDIDLLPVPIASRCKLSIAGNRAVRYAAYASAFPVKRREKLIEGMRTDDIARVMEKNTRITLMKGIVELLISLQGNHKAQSRMHPMSKSRPVVKNLTLKMTRVIVEYLTEAGRAGLADKITTSKISAFMIDKNFYGVENDGVRTWPILNNVDADFKDLSIEAIKGYYGVE